MHDQSGPYKKKPREYVQSKKMQGNLANWRMKVVNHIFWTTASKLESYIHISKLIQMELKLIHSFKKSQAKLTHSQTDAGATQMTG